MGGKSYCFCRKNRLNFRFRSEKPLDFGEDLFFLRSPVFGRKKRLNFRFWLEKSLWISAKTFLLWRSPDFGRKKRLNFRFWPEKAFGFRRRPFFFVDHLIFTEKSPQSNSGTMKIWVKFVHGSTFQKSPLLSEILATCLFFTKVQSTLKKRPPIQNFTI